MRRAIPILLLAVAATSCGLFGNNNVFELAVGTCFNDEGEGGATEVAGVPIVDCAEPHDNEVYATFDIADGSFPGIELLEQDAFDGCLQRFPGFVGTSWEASDLDFTFLYPTQDSWDRLDDREIVCVVYRVDLEQVTGSLEGSAL